MTAIASLSGSVFPGFVEVYVSTLGSDPVRRTFFSMANGTSLNFGAETFILPDIWVIPILGCENLIFEGGGGFTGSVDINVRFLSNTPVIDLSGVTCLNAGSATSLVAPASITDSESNSPLTLLSASSERVDIVTRNLLYGGDQGGFFPPIWVRERIPRVYKTLDAVTVASSGTAVWEPTGGLIPRLMGYHLSTDTSGRYYLRSNAGGTLIDTLRLGANWPDRPVDLRNGIPLDASDHKLFLHGPTGAVVSGKVWGIEEAGGI